MGVIGFQVFPILDAGRTQSEVALWAIPPVVVMIAVLGVGIHYSCFHVS